MLVSGEPGIGKSRLTAALSERIENEPHTRIRYFCSPHDQDSALHPFIGQLERGAGFARDDTATIKLDKLGAVLGDGAEPGDLWFIAEMLSLSGGERFPPLDLSPQRKKERTLAALLRQLQAPARRQPVLMIFEDLHWIDPTSRELLDLTLDRVRRLPVLLIVTFRPEFQQAWSGQPHVTMLALNRLGERDVTALVRGLAGNAPLGNEIVEEIVERTDGVPLFIEELTKAVLERAGQDHRVAAVLSASPLPALAVPSTLHASLISRLDRIGAAAKEVAQIGAVIGREFSYELIQFAAQRSEAELQAALTRLTEAGLLFSRGTPPHASYLFKHALLQDAAYGTLLRSRRQELHARVAAALEQHFGDVVERQPELLAHHLTAAGEGARAADQWLKTGRYAAARSAHLEAIGHFGRGLAAASSLSQTRERDRREIRLQLDRGVSFITAKGFLSADAAQAFARAKELCEQTGDANNLFPALWNVWVTTAALDLNAARPLSDRLLALARTKNDSALILESHHSAWATHFLAGEPAPARTHCDEGRRLYDFDRHRALATEYGGHDPGLCGCNHGAWCEWLLGYPDTAVASIGDGRRLAERLAQPLSLNHNFSMEAALRLFRGEPEMALRRAQEAEAVATDQRIQSLMEPRILQGRALVARGAVADGLELIKQGTGAAGGLFGVFYRTHHLAVVSEALCCAGDYDGAAAALAEAAAAMEKSSERWWQAEIERLGGVLLIARRNIAEGAACFERAIETARRQQAKSLELRAAVSLARLWGEQGQREEARDLLAPVYGWFIEGFDTTDLKEAKSLLDELS